MHVDFRVLFKERKVAGNQEREEWIDELSLVSQRGSISGDFSKMNDFTSWYESHGCWRRKC